MTAGDASGINDGAAAVLRVGETLDRCRRPLGVETLPPAEALSGGAGTTGFHCKIYRNMKTGAAKHQSFAAASHEPLPVN